jgi:hypothetical protein
MANPRPDPRRYTYVYHPSREHKEQWKKLAKKDRTPLSKFIIEIVDSAIDEKAEFKPRGEMAKDMEALKAENKALRDDLRQKTIVLEHYENDLKKYRSQSFLKGDYQGIRRYSKEIVDLLKAKTSLDSYRLLEALGIDPKDSDLVKAVSLQLEELEGYGVIKLDGRKWRWIG